MSDHVEAQRGFAEEIAERLDGEDVTTADVLEALGTCGLSLYRVEEHTGEVPVASLAYIREVRRGS